MAQYAFLIFIYVKSSDDLAGSIFYFGYLIAQYPAGLAMQKLPVGKFLASTTISMKSITACILSWRSSSL